MKFIKDSGNKKRVIFPKRKYRQIIVYCGWGIFLFGFMFAVYKNFTAINRETVVRQVRIKEKVRNVSGVESFVKNFALEYFSLTTDNDFKNQRSDQLKKYMSETLITASSDMLNDLKDNVEVTSVQIWNVSVLGKNDYNVLFTVNQKVNDNMSTSAYVVKIHKEGNDYSVVRLPRLATIPSKAKYEETYLKSSDKVSVEERRKVKTFLQTFFKVYPKADSTELSFYLEQKNLLQPIYKNYEFVSIDGLAITSKNKNYQAEFFVKYKDRDSGVFYSTQYKMAIGKKQSGELVISSIE